MNMTERSMSMSLKKVEDIRKKIIKNILIFIIFFAVILIGILDLTGIVPHEEIYSFFGLCEVTEKASDIEVHFLDVGQGDCEFINTKDKNVLIDTGEKDKVEIIIAYLKKLGVKKLDYVVLTHPHSDHIGGFKEISEEFLIDAVIMPEINKEIIPTTETYKSMLNVVQKSGCKVIKSTKEKCILDDETNLVLLTGDRSSYDNLNNCSVVCMLKHNDKKMLFMGDAEKEVEQELIKSGVDLSCNVIKIGHHGSNTSSTEEFLKKVVPKCAIISVGADNSFKHPSDEAIDRIKEYCKQIYRTDIDGSIVIREIEGSLQIKTKWSEFKCI